MVESNRWTAMWVTTRFWGRSLLIKLQLAPVSVVRQISPTLVPAKYVVLDALGSKARLRIVPVVIAVLFTTQLAAPFSVRQPSRVEASKTGELFGPML